MEPEFPPLPKGKTTMMEPGKTSNPLGEGSYRPDFPEEEAPKAEAPSPQDMERSTAESPYASSKNLEGLWCGVGYLCCMGEFWEFSGRVG